MGNLPDEQNSSPVQGNDTVYSNIYYNQYKIYAYRVFHTLNKVAPSASVL